MEVFSALNLFGAGVLAIMMVFYILEPKSPFYSLLFGLMCIGSSAYGFLSGAWPFGVIEAVWTLVSIRKFYNLRYGKQKSQPA